MINVDTSNLDKLRKSTSELETQLSVNQFIKTSKKDLEKILEILPIMICIIDLDYNILKVNKQTLDYYNTTLDNLLGKKCYEICHDDSSEPPGFCPLCKTIGAGLKETITEIAFDEKESKWILITVAPLTDENGEVTSVAHILQDLTCHISTIYGNIKR